MCVTSIFTRDFPNGRTETVTTPSFCRLSRYYMPCANHIISHHHIYSAPPYNNLPPTQLGYNPRGYQVMCPSLHEPHPSIPHLNPVGEGTGRHARDDKREDGLPVEQPPCVFPENAPPSQHADKRQAKGKRREGSLTIEQQVKYFGTETTPPPSPSWHADKRQAKDKGREGSPTVEQHAKNFGTETSPPPSPSWHADKRQAKGKRREGSPTVEQRVKYFGTETTPPPSPSWHADKRQAKGKRREGSLIVEQFHSFHAANASSSQHAYKRRAKNNNDNNNNNRREGRPLVKQPPRPYAETASSSQDSYQRKPLDRDQHAIYTVALDKDVKNKNNHFNNRHTEL